MSYFQLCSSDALIPNFLRGAAATVAALFSQYGCWNVKQDVWNTCTAYASSLARALCRETKPWNSVMRVAVFWRQILFIFCMRQHPFNGMLAVIRESTIQDRMNSRQFDIIQVSNMLYLKLTCMRVKSSNF